MRILAFSDLHCDVAAAEAIVAAALGADVLVGCGDFATRGRGGAAVLEVLKLSPVPVLLVHGNHDDPQALRAFCAGWEQGHLLHGGGVTLGGVRFFGLGGEVPCRNSEPWNASESEARAAELLQGFTWGQGEQAVLLTHTPPLGVADLQRDGSHEGSSAIRDAIAASQPQLCLCGHIHNAWGLTGRIGRTEVRNLGPGLNWITL
mgnify:FL=1